MQSRRLLAAAGLALAAAVGCTTQHGAARVANPAATPLVVYLVRHAEKADAPAADPDLSEAGAARARALRDALRDAGVRAIVTSDRRRTQQTAQPLAAALAIAPTVVPLQAGADHVSGVASQVTALGAGGGAVLVVGHSNTVPAIVRALGGPAMPDLCDAEYSRLFVLVRGADGRVTLARASYGAPDAAGAGECRAMAPGR